MSPIIVTIAIFAYVKNFYGFSIWIILKKNIDEVQAQELQSVFKKMYGQLMLTVNIALTPPLKGRDLHRLTMLEDFA